MKLRGIFAALLCVVLIVAAMPSGILTASAQECIWDYYIGDTVYSASQLAAGAVPGLSASGNTLVMNGYTGTSVSAIPGGFYGDDDAPVLKINLIGENKLTGSYYDGNYPVAGKPSGSGAWFGALYSATRAGGSGENSGIVISGSGSLDISAKKSSTATASSNINIIPVVCGTLTVNSGTVNIEYGGNGVKAARVCGVDCDSTEISGSGVLNIKAVLRTASIIKAGKINRIKSDCAVAGVDGSVTVHANKGWFAADLGSAVTASADVKCVTGKVNYNNSYSGLYLIAPVGKALPETVIPSGWTEGFSYKKYSFSDSTYVYEAYGPAGAEQLTYNTALNAGQLYAVDVFSGLELPVIGDDKIFEEDFTKDEEKGFFIKKQSFLTEIETGQAWSSDSWSKYAKNAPGTCYEFDFFIRPLPGRWYVPGACGMTGTQIAGAVSDAGVLDSGIASSYLYVYCVFDVPVITKQPEALYAGDASVGVEATSANGEPKYAWFMDVYAPDGVLACTLTMDYFDEMSYGFTCQNENEMFLGSLDEEETVPGFDFTFGEASKLTLFCEVSCPGGKTTSEKVEYKAFENSVVTIKKQPVNAVFKGGKASFTFEAEGDGVSYRWYMDDMLLTSGSSKPGKYGFSGINTGTLTVIAESEISEALLAGKKFACCAEDRHRTAVTSDFALLGRQSDLPSVTKQPADCEYIIGGDSPVFTVNAQGAELSYQWYRDGKALTDVTSNGVTVKGSKTAQLTLSAAGKAFPDGTATDLYCEITNAFGKAQTNKAGVVTVPAPGFKTQPVNCTASLDHEGVFTAALEKTDGVKYQWYLSDGTKLADTETAPAWKISGTATNTLRVTARTPYSYKMASFYCVATYKGVEIKSETASLIEIHECVSYIEKVGAKAATCTADGIKAHYKCTKCEKLYSDAAATKALTAKDVVIAAAGHKWDAGRVTTAATCAKEGVKTFTCTVCKATKTEKIAKTAAHKWDAGRVTTAATCAKEGVKTFTCMVCKATKTEKIAKTAAHKWDAGRVTTAATCAKEGVNTFTCTVCKATKTEKIAKTTAHKWDAGRVTTAATATAEGVMTYTCTVCKTTKTEKIPKTGVTATLGDVDNDGDIDISDARLCLRRAIQLEKYAPGSREFIACDVDRSGTVTITDARSVLRVAIKLDKAEIWNR